MEWFRDLSLTILGLVTTAVLIFTAILVYRVDRRLTAALNTVKATSKIAFDAFTLVQGGPLGVISTLMRHISPEVRVFNQKFQKRKSLGRNK